MPNALLELSQSSAAAVERASSHVAAIQGHPRYASSGVLWAPGIIVGADHMLAEVERVEIALPSGTAIAQLAGRDRATGLAVFRAEHSTTPPTTTVDDTLRAGSLALVAGRTTRSGPTASMGVIASVAGPWRTRLGGAIDRHIQLDITLFPSSNGGAVVDAEGRLIGIASSNFSRYGAIAIPNSTVNRVVETILATGHVPRGYLGVGLREVALPGEQRAALILLSVEPGGSAAQAGLLLGDVLVTFNGKPVQDAEDLQALLGPDAVGTTVKAEILRAGQRLEIPVTIGQRKREA